MKKIFVLLFLFSHSCLFACSCLYVSLQDQYNSADLIFTGKVVNDPDYDYLNYNLTYLFEIIKTYKGADSDSISIYTGRGGGDCGYGFTKGEQYLVYAYKGENGFSTSICTRTTHINGAHVDLEYLNRLPGSLETASITGTVSLFIDNTISRYNLPVFKNYSFVLRNEKNSYSVITDNNGVYYIDNILPGIYEIIIVGSSELAVKYNYDDAIVVKNNEVTEFNIILTNYNTISGVLLNENDVPIENGIVELFPEQYFKDPENSYMYETFEFWTDEDGLFNFNNIPNGKYYLGINMNHIPWSVTPYSKTYYKDADSISSATLLDVGVKNIYSDIILKVKKTYKTYSIICKLRTEDGEIWNDASVELRKTNDINDYEYFVHALKLNDKGEFIIETVEDTEGWIVVEPRDINQYTDRGLYVKKPSPIKIETNKNYDELIIIIEFLKR